MSDTYTLTPNGEASDALASLLGCLANDYGSERWRRFMDHTDHLDDEDARAVADAAYKLLNLLSDPWIEGDWQEATKWRAGGLEPKCERCAASLAGAA
jgi:hypothetical protein